MRAVVFTAAVIAVQVNAAAAQVPVDQGTTITVIDSIAVTGARRVSAAAIMARAGIPLGIPISFRDVQQAINELYSSGQFADVRVLQGTVDGQQTLVFEVVERPLLVSWAVRGVEKISERKVRGRVRLLEGRPYDPATAAEARAAIDSLYQHEGYHGSSVTVQEIPQEDGTLRVIYDIDEGRRVTVSRVVVEGNEEFSDGTVVDQIKTGPEGFWWFSKGEYKDEELDEDLRERLPGFYGSRGFVDFQVVGDSLAVDRETGKGTLFLDVEEGERYHVGTFEIVGNRHFSAEQLEQFFPFGHEGGGFLGLGGGPEGPSIFDQRKWEEATQEVQSAYANDGYIYARINPLVSRRQTSDTTNVVDLRWQIIEGQPAIVNKVLIRGNDVTHEDVIRRAIVVVPGDVMRQDALIQSYQSISNLGFFEQPLPPPNTEQANQQGDVNVVFHVQERHTGNINFGASVGQGTGVGGFIGLDEPNLFGRGKQVTLQWQFGRNINDVNISYTDPAIRGSLISGTISAHNSRLRYTVADLGRIRSRGVSFQLGFPVRGSRFTRLLTTYTFEQSDFDSPTLESRFICDNCILSQIGLALVRDTRIDLPFPTAGSMHRLDVQQAGGPLGGSGDFRRATLEGRWYAPLGQLGGGGPTGGGIRFVLGLTARTGFVWGDVGPHFRQLFSMGGTQFGIRLRGYDEFSITPAGFDPSAQGFRANTVDAFGRSYLALSGEIGARLSQAFYLNGFMDAGNVWASPGQYNPTRLFRGAGAGISLLSPLGPIGIDYAYGFDRVDRLGNPAPAWKFHFKLGNFF
jgi:outer membrane protein insertion porin family